MSVNNKKNHGTVGRKTGKIRRIRLKHVIFAFLSILLISLIGVSAYIWQLLGRPGQTNIPVVTGGEVKDGILDDLKEPDETDGTENASSSAGNSAPISYWGNGRVKVYVNSKFPIVKVEQKDPDVENILLVGLDARASSQYESRTDSIMVVSIDKSNNSVKLTSFMRDTQVKIPGRTKPTKINAAYVFGGIGLLINTMNNNFELDIQKFAMVDMWSAEKVIDAAGGVTINIKPSEVEHVNKLVNSTNQLFKKISNPATALKKSGLQHLDGRQAVAYGRIRYIGNDQERTLRQRTVLSAMIQSFKKSSLSSKMAVFNVGSQAFETNIPKNDLLFLAFDVLAGMKNIQQYRVPENGMFTTNTSNWNIIIDFKTQNPALHKFIWGNEMKNVITMPAESSEVSSPVTSVPVVNSDISPPASSGDSSGSSSSGSSGESSSYNSSESSDPVSGNSSGSSSGSSLVVSSGNSSSSISNT